jgi:hypothetical protein
MGEPQGHRIVKVMVETDRRTFVGDVHMTSGDDRYRLSDHLNAYDKNFVCLSNVRVKDRGQEHRPGDQRDFVAISIAAITYVTPLEGE